MNHETKFTKCKWHVTRHGETNHPVLKIRPSGILGSIAILKEGLYNHPDGAQKPYEYEHMLADAELIAAAPCMYGALEMALQNLSYFPVENYFAIEHIKDVMKRARGDIYAP